ncbi:MAG: hypothetical protein PUP92_40545 [Rhizonema sp. PD38]|nr:hypothetical protein [Rhizonema sp. PD38]
MFSKYKLLTLCIGTLAVSAFGVGIAQAALTNQSKVVINGIDTVRVGMTVAQASKASGTRLVPTSQPNNSCYYVKPQTGLRNLNFMVTNGRIARVDVQKDSAITTLKGARIGDTESKIKSLYPGQIKVTPHKYVNGGHYLTLVPKNGTNTNDRIVFETDGKRVTAFRAGKLPEVEYVEGCS